ncbi:MerR family transcriptional regulator [Bacillus sp. V3-13]|uniref:MerR family transcriptional regulator n=1 Tax=Bacillus sp. V3-13 TaxID=2053728 RepID=UPI000C76A8D9|nr:MerR family transcriptional regulator [Bacillus sp. V3-13]PLR78988.1 MerR family transcriptional regulator [Bacillus sp. V3-13]
MEKSFTIQQVSMITDLSGHTLRYYEKIGLLNGVARNEHGYRQFSETDISWIHFLIRLRITGMAVNDMKRFSDLRSQGESTITARRELLEMHQRKVLDEMEELAENLEKIEEKIGHYKKLEGQN